MNIRSKRGATNCYKYNKKNVGRDRTKHLKSRQQKSEKLNTTGIVISIIASLTTTLYTLLQILIELRHSLK